jgi:transcriptional regulator GlxA family with amidase domain
MLPAIRRCLKVTVRATPIDLMFVIVPHSLLLDIAGPSEAFRLANLHREARGLPPRFRVGFAGPSTTLPTSVGLALGDLAPLPDRLDDSHPTWVVVVGQPTAHVSHVTPEIAATARWLKDRLRDTLDGKGKRKAGSGTPDTPHRLVTICSGTLLAARAGVLGTRRCTTHHELLPMLRVLAPRAEVVENRVFVVDGPLASSAGVTAGIDLALHLISEECGEALASSVAEDMVVYLRRSPRDTELSPFHMHRRHLHPTVHRVQDAIVTEPQRDWDMRSLADVGHTAERHLLRLFVDHAGISPLHYLRLIRLERRESELVAGRNVLACDEGVAVDLDVVAGGDRPQRDGHVVTLVDADHRRTLRRRRGAAFDHRAVGHRRYVSFARSYANARAITRASSMSIR